MEHDRRTRLVGEADPISPLSSEEFELKADTQPVVTIAESEYDTLKHTYLPLLESADPDTQMWAKALFVKVLEYTERLKMSAWTEERKKQAGSIAIIAGMVEFLVVMFNDFRLPAESHPAVILLEAILMLAIIASTFAYVLLDEQKVELASLTDEISILLEQLSLPQANQTVLYSVIERENEAKRLAGKTFYEVKKVGKSVHVEINNQDDLYRIVS